MYIRIILFRDIALIKRSNHNVGRDLIRGKRDIYEIYIICFDTGV